MLNIKKYFNLQLFAEGEDDLETSEGTEVESAANPQDKELTEETEVEELEEDNTEETKEDETEEETVLDNSKAFAQRLSKKTAQIEAQMKEQYGKYYGALEREAKKYGVTTEEYVAELDRLAAEEEAERLEQEKAAEKERYNGLSEKEKKALEVGLKQLPQMEQQAEWDKQGKQLLKDFPNIKSVKDIPEVVFEMYDKYKVPYSETYAKLVPKSTVNAEAERIKAEQQALKIAQSTKSPGALSGTTQETKKSVNDMSKDEFQTYIEKIKRGEIR